MKVTQFTCNPEVSDYIKELKDDWENKECQVSDIIDAAGNQYVDLVMEGGGVLGIALVGYTYALESVGIRFRHVGGTSAGAINALMVAALGTPDQRKSGKVVNVLSNLNMFSFVDGDSDAKDFVGALVDRSGWIKLAWKGVQVLDDINDHLGLNPGQVFHDWMDEQLKKACIGSVQDLRTQMTAPELSLRDGMKLGLKDRRGDLAVVAADVSTFTKAVFPQMADLYWRRPSIQSPATFVRASMSIPGFFHPLRVANIPQGKKRAPFGPKKPAMRSPSERGSLRRRWYHLQLSIDLFHSTKPPKAPTFGVKLGIDRSRPVVIEKPTHMLGAVFNAARQGADQAFLNRHKDYRHLVAFIQTGEHHWLNFNMNEKGKIKLFTQGVKAARDFLRDFDWKGYKEMRSKMADE